jgi:hypothetical protein
MALIVTIPDTYQAERDYIISLIFTEFLGLDYVVQLSGNADVCISDKDNGRRLIIPDRLFAIPREQWLTQESLPKEPLEVWDPRTMGFSRSLEFPPIPIIYGECKPGMNGRDHADNGQELRLSVDIFGSCFFMLTRYEEVVKPTRDEHDRFPATASIAYTSEFLDRPIVDEYVEILWAAMKWLCPGLVRKKGKFAMRVSHDVDESSRYGFLSIPQTIRAMGGDILIRGNIIRALRGPLIRINSRNQIHPADPYNTFDYIMDISERDGLISAFYFICGRSHKNYDARYEIDHPAMRHLLRHIHERGHEIGLHPSYYAYKSPQTITNEAARLRRICEEEGIQQTEWGGRMHFLRWETPITLYGWEQAGMTYDSTMSYADCAGFRCGTCHEYPAFDPVKKETVKLRIRPLIAMECTVLDKKYMGLNRTAEAYNVFMKLKNACKSVGGTFTLLWHNTQFATRQKRELYEAVIKS